VVLNAIQGPDDHDFSVIDVPFNWDANLDIRRLRVGYLKELSLDTGKRRKWMRMMRRRCKTARYGIELVRSRYRSTPTWTWTIIYGEEMRR